MIRRLPGRLYMTLIFLFLYAPVFVLIIFSFNAAKSRAVWGGFTLEWYRKLFENRDIMNALRVTLTVAFISAIVATLIATITCLGLDAMKRRWRQAIMTITYIPNVSPDLVTGISLMLLFFFVRIQTGFATLLLAHIAFNIPYAILSISPKLRQLDRNLFEAALDLGCKPAQAIWRVILPEIMPGIVTALILTFTLSIDDFVISYFTAGNQISTLAITIYSMARKSVNPQINALSTLLFVAVLGLLLLVNSRSGREKKDSLGGNRS
ncbi:MAG: ABC transporter permease [Ruminococcaceae bacterium]|jgi:spermidine/putrescine transport system permease protein|nr:ABC transporter permease [Oscillospiraceae bacterium]